MIEAVLALGLEAAVGYPDPLYRRIGHPVTWIGRLITGMEARFNRPETPQWRRRGYGVAAAAVIAASGAGFGWALQRLCGRSLIGRGAMILLATPGLAQRSLYQHVDAVRRPLMEGDLPAARTAVARVVGRDVAALDQTGVAMAALETLAESFNDGVVAPAFWLAVAGLPGLYAYKALNTADSLIGHREPRWRAFGWASARADDLLNLIPARIAGALIALAGGSGWRAMIHDAPKHASPNAGWPEAAMAGALNVWLGGPAAYDGEIVQRPTFNTAAPAPTPDDLRRGLTGYRNACILLALGVGACALAQRRR
jgi:adenosylcobinamide-phosphate synthase